MAEKSGRNRSIDELTAEIAQSRERVTRDLREKDLCRCEKRP